MSRVFPFSSTLIPQDFRWSHVVRCLFRRYTRVFAFHYNELESTAPQVAQKDYLRKFEFVPPPPPHGYVHIPPAQPVPIEVEGELTEIRHAPHLLLHLAIVVKAKGEMAFAREERVMGRAA